MRALGRSAAVVSEAEPGPEADPVAREVFRAVVRAAVDPAGFLAHPGVPGGVAQAGVPAGFQGHLVEVFQEHLAEAFQVPLGAGKAREASRVDLAADRVPEAFREDLAASAVSEVDLADRIKMVACKRWRPLPCGPSESSSPRPMESGAKPISRSTPAPPRIAVGRASPFRCRPLRDWIARTK